MNASSSIPDSRRASGLSVLPLTRKLALADRWLGLLPARGRPMLMPVSASSDVELERGRQCCCCAVEARTTHGQHIPTPGVLCVRTPCVDKR